MSTTSQRLESLTPSDVCADIFGWLKGMASGNLDPDNQVLAKYSQISPQNPFAEGRYHMHERRAIYSLPLRFAVTLEAPHSKTGGSVITHQRKIYTAPEAPTINVTGLPDEQYDFEIHGPREYGGTSPFVGGSFIEVRGPSPDESDLTVKIEAEQQSTPRPVYGEHGIYQDSAVFRLGDLPVIKFDVVKGPRVESAVRAPL